METTELFENGYAIPVAIQGGYVFRYGTGRYRQEVTLRRGVVPITFVGEHFVSRWDQVLKAQE